MTTSLDPPYGARDASGMAGRIAGAPGQIEAALAATAATPWVLPIADPPLLAVGGLGGSAIAADLVCGVWADRLPRPIVVTRDDRWPASVRPGVLALLSSYSGNTAETLALYDEAGARGVARVAMTSGGALAERCARDGVPCMSLPGGSPPRAALWSGWVTLTMLVHALGWIEDPADAWRAAAALLSARNADWGPEAPEPGNAAKAAARLLASSRPFVYGADPRLAPVVKRFRNQLNENAKLLAHSDVLPELDHNEIVGWERPGDAAGDAVLVTIMDAGDSEMARLRLAATLEQIRAHGVRVVECEAREGGRLARAASLVHFGDYVSLYTALVRGVDPTPIPSIDTLKRRLDERGGARAR